MREVKKCKGESGEGRELARAGGLRGKICHCGGRGGEKEEKMGRMG